MPLFYVKNKLLWCLEPLYTRFRWAGNTRPRCCVTALQPHIPQYPSALENTPFGAIRKVEKNLKKHLIFASARCILSKLAYGREKQCEALPFQPRRRKLLCYQGISAENCPAFEPGEGVLASFSLSKEKGNARQRVSLKMSCKDADAKPRNL